MCDGDGGRQSHGQQATFADIQEGSKVKATCISHDGKNSATRIEVIAPEGGPPSPTLGERDSSGSTRTGTKSA